MSDNIKLYYEKQKAPENPLRLKADRQSAIQYRDCTLKNFNKYLRTLSYNYSHISPPPLNNVPMRGSFC